MEIMLTPKQYSFLDNKDISTKAKLNEINTYIQQCKKTNQYPDEDRWFQLLHIRKKLLQIDKGVFDEFNYGF